MIWAYIVERAKVEWASWSAEERAPNVGQDEVMGDTGTWKGWIGYSSAPGGMDHLPPDVRAEIERRAAALKKRQGRLLCEVHVHVYEHDAVPGVAFPPDALLDVESDPREIASAVAQAQAALADWR